MNGMANAATVLLDAEAMGALFQRELAGYDNVLVGACRIHQTRWRISRKTEEQGAPYLGVVYALELERPDGSAPATHWLYLKAYTRDASADALASPVGLPVTHLAGLDALVWALPNDPAMPHLAEFLSAAALGRYLRPRALGGAPLKADLPQIVRYEPEQHCTARFAFQARDQRRACYGKCYADASWQAVERRLGALYRLSQNAGGAFAIGQPLGSSRTLQAVWQEEVPGVALRAALAGPDSERWIERVARGLVRLHGMAPLGDAVLAPHGLLERTLKQRNKLVRAEPRLAPAIDPVLHILRQGVPAGAAPVPIHGDFHLDQMLCAGELVALFDFDNFAQGSPAHDVADFISQLVLDPGFEPHRAAALARCFIASYQAQAGAPFALAELEWYLRLLYLRKAYSLFVRHRSGWRERVVQACRLAAHGLHSITPQSMEITA